MQVVVLVVYVACRGGLGGSDWLLSSIADALDDLAPCLLLHERLGRRHYNLAPPVVLRRRHSDVVQISRVGLKLDNFGLHAKACFLFVLEHCLDKLAHNSALLRLDLIGLNLEVLVFLSHLVKAHSKLVALLVKLCLLPEVQLLGKLGLILAFSQLLLERLTR